jgi:hypothetical protein
MTKSVPFDEFYRATGRAVAAWQGLEDALCDVFTRTVVCGITGLMLDYPHAYRMVGEIFYSSTNFRANLDMLNRVIAHAVRDEEICSEWNAIRNRSLSLYKRRNTIAHGHVWGNAAGASRVRASLFNPNARRDMDYSQVLASEQSFIKMAERARRLAIRINKHLAHRPS